MKATITTGVGFDADGHKISPGGRDLVTSTLRTYFAAACGGSTVLTGSGSWVGPNGDLVVEEIQQWIVFGATRQQAREFAVLVKEAYGQRSVLLEITDPESSFV